MRSSSRLSWDEIRLISPNQVNELPNNGAHIPVVQQAEALMRRMELEQKAYALLDEAMQKRDLNALVNAIAGCDRMQPPLEHAKVDKARELKVRSCLPKSWLFVPRFGPRLAWTVVRLRTELGSE